jgi:hypothetical protein
MGQGILAMGVVAALLANALPAMAQTFTNDDPLLRRIWEEGMEKSHTYQLSQTLMDSIGPRLTGSPGHEAGNDWLVATYQSWGISARKEQYGTWMQWRRGKTHVDLVEPRVRSLEAMMLAWSPGTGGKTVKGSVVTFPDVATPSQFDVWLPSVRGKFVAISFPEPTCRPDGHWLEFAASASFERLQVARDSARAAWDHRMSSAGFDMGRGRSSLTPVAQRLEQAGAVGVLTSSWPGGWGVHRIFNAGTEQVPTVGLSCEDYGLVFRLAEHNQNPVLEVMTDAEFLGEGPVFNTIAEIRGTELPDEYVMLSAHFDSWDGGSGTTDNGTGTVTMLEAMRILRAVYPRPKRTIVVGHWGGEEQGLNGSRAFAADHPEIVEGLQALFNQDNGTGRVVNVSSQGLTKAAGPFARWLSLVPSDITSHIRFRFPGTASSGGTDHAAFICYGAPAFSLGSLSWLYSPYTWHTNRDTFDKIVFDDLENNATLTAMLVYLASEDPERTPRERRTVFPVSSYTGQPTSWPECQQPRRSWAERRR